LAALARSAARSASPSSCAKNLNQRLSSSLWQVHKDLIRSTSPIAGPVGSR
jgi:hypothetical protein